MPSHPQPAPSAPIAPGERERLAETLVVLAEHQAWLTQAFYERFFERHPEVVPLFGAHAVSEREEMMNETLTSLAAWCEEEPWLADNLNAMGASHWEYGVTGPMYDAFTRVFIECAREPLGDGWNEALEAALSCALGEITRTMRSSADRAETRALERKRRAERAG